MEEEDAFPRKCSQRPFRSAARWHRGLRCCFCLFFVPFWMQAAQGERGPLSASVIVCTVLFRQLPSKGALSSVYSSQETEQCDTVSIDTAF